MLLDIIAFALFHTVMCNSPKIDSVKCTRVIAGRLNQPDIGLPPSLEPTYNLDVSAIMNGVHHVMEKESRIVVLYYIRLAWTDMRLAFANETACESVPWIDVYPLTRIWFPMIIVLDSYDQTVMTDIWVGGRVRIQRDGTIRWGVSWKYNQQCNFDMTHFPADRQTCAITIYFAPSYIVPKLGSISTVQFVHNPSWHLAKTNHTIHFGTDLPESYTYKVLFTVERHFGFFVLSLIGPTVVLSPLNAVTFILPPDSGEKLSVALTTLLTYFVMSLTVTQSIPETQRLPTISMIFGVLTTACVIAACCAAIITRRAAYEQGKESIDCRKWATKMNNTCCVVFALTGLTTTGYMVAKIVLTPSED